MHVGHRRSGSATRLAFGVPNTTPPLPLLKHETLTIGVGLRLWIVPHLGGIVGLHFPTSQTTLTILRVETNFVVEGLHLGEQERGVSRHLSSGRPNSRSCKASWWQFMHDSTWPAEVTCLPSAVTVP